MSSKCKIHRGFQNASVWGEKRTYKHLINIFILMLELNILDILGYKKILKLMSPVFFLNVTVKEHLKLEM